jgi:hypothetical protein
MLARTGFGWSNPRQRRRILDFFSSLSFIYYTEGLIKIGWEGD